ncbi:MAG TPA: hypothetical protein VKF38_03000 [Anaerolineaceae bacterium]|nr:hypothetical protein [Anaerolineaceae bacterium]
MEFYGIPVGSLENSYLQLNYLIGAGPRIVRLVLKDPSAAGNLLAEVPDKKIDTHNGTYYFRGGHRLAYAPETFPGTYYPDNEGLSVEKITGGVRLCQPTEPLTGIRKAIDICLDSNRPALTLTHHLYNDSNLPVDLAPWGITQLRLGGLALLPMSPALSGEKSLRPNRNLVLWSYTRWGDPRLEIDDDYVLAHAQPASQPCKLGTLNLCGWVAYLNDNVLLVKRFEPQPELPHPDMGCNVEVYCNDEYIELETLAPMQHLLPGQESVFPETWEFYAGLPDLPMNIDRIRSIIEALHLSREQSTG